MESTLLERDNGTNSFTCLNQHLSIPKPALQIQGPNFQIMEPAFEAEDPEPTDSETRLSPLRYRFPNCEMLDVGRGSVVGRGVCVWGGGIHWGQGLANHAMENLAKQRRKLSGERICIYRVRAGVKKHPYGAICLSVDGAENPSLDPFQLCV